MNKLICICLSICSGLRFNEVVSSIEDDATTLAGRRRRRRKGISSYDSSNVEYIVTYAGSRTSTASKVTAYTNKLAEDIAVVVLANLQLTAGVAETSAKVIKDIKDNLKISDWTPSSALLQTTAGTFTDFVTWPENPGWKTTSKVSDSVFDSLFKTSGFSAALKAKIIAQCGTAPYTQYGVDSSNTALISVVERTVSTSTLTGTFKIRLTVSNPAGGENALTPKGSFSSEVAVTRVQDEGNAQELMYQAKSALANAFRVNLDYVSVERSDQMSHKCSTQIMFNFPTQSEVGNKVAAADLLVKAALLDRSFEKVFQQAAATVLNVDVEKITMNTFLTKSDLGGALGTGTAASRIIDMQLKYETPCTGLTGRPAGGGKFVAGESIPKWYDEEAFRVESEIGTGNEHLVFINKIWTEAVKSSPYSVTYTKACEDDFKKIAGGDVSANNPKMITLVAGALLAANLKQGITNTRVGVDDKVYADGKGRTNTDVLGKDMNVNWGEVPNNEVGTEPWANNAEYRIKYLIAIKNAEDSKAATMIQSYVKMADDSADDTDAFSVKVKDSLAGSNRLLNLGCTVTNVWMRSEATKTIF